MLGGRSPMDPELSTTSMNQGLTCTCAETGATQANTATASRRANGLALPWVTAR